METPRQSFTLRNKLIVALLLAALVPLALLAASVHRNTRKALEDNANQALFAVAAQAAESLDQFVQTTLRTVGTEAHLPAITDYMALSPEQQADSPEEAAMIDLLDVISTKSDYISSYALLDTAGRVVYDTQVENIGADESAESWVTFFDPETLGIESEIPDITRTLHGVRLRNHDIFVSEVELSSLTGLPSLYFSSPVHDLDGTYFGLLRASLDATVLQSLLTEKNDQAGAGSFGVLFDEHNIRLAHGTQPEVDFIPIVPLDDATTDQLIALKRLPDLPTQDLYPLQLDNLHQALENAETQRFFEATDVATGNLVNQVAVDMMTTQRWKVAFFQPQTVFLAPIRAQTQQTIVLATIIAGLVSIAGILAARLLTRPLKRLTRTAEAVSAGNLDVEADIRTNDEFGLLAHTFNGMTGQLRSLIASLEERVADRTQALATANRELQDQRDFAQQVVSSMGQGLAVSDARGKLTYVNPTFERLLGRDQSDLLGQTSFDLFMSSDHEAIEAMMGQIAQGNSATSELRLNSAENNEKWVLATVSPRLRGDKIIGAIGVVTDLTDIKAAARELAIARDAALESSRLKSEFLATMSHEIRTPMNGIIGMSEMLLKTRLDSEQLDHARIVQSEAHSLLAIINDILDFSKVEAGKLAITKTDFDLHALLKHILEPMQPQAAQKGLTLDLAIAPEVARYVHADEGHIKQVLVNLIGNALKFTKQGKVSITVAHIAQNDARSRVRFDVVDTGIGIADDALPHLFEPFVQADGSLTRKHGGTGLGLAISKRLVALMGGQLGVETAVGQGSRFWFELPLETAHEIPQAPVVEEVVTVSAENHVLLVEDYLINQKVILKQLERLGYTADVAENGQIAVDMLRANRHQYNLVLMDLQMPVMDGLTATSEIRKLGNQLAPRIPIIAVTANAMEGDIDRCIAAGMDDYIAKPVTTKILKAKLEKWNGG